MVTLPSDTIQIHDHVHTKKQVSCSFSKLECVSRLPGANEKSQRSFTNKWISSHIHDAQKIIRKPLLITEFGWNNSGFGTKTRDVLFNAVYSKIYSSARRGGVAAGGMFWQLLAQGLDSFRDGYQIVLSENPSTACVIAKQSRKLTHIREIYARRRRNMKKKNKGKKIGGI